jgi:hypothetical protein
MTSSFDKSDPALRELLDAGRSERPSQRGLRRTTLAAAAAASAAATSGTAVAGISLGAIAHWTLVGAVSGTLVAGGALSLQQRPEPLARPAPTSSAALPAQSLAPAVLASVAPPSPPVEAAVAATPDTARSRRPSPAKLDSRRELAEEVELLDRARGKLRIGDTAEARALLEQHGTRFVGGRLGQEALYLAMETACTSGHTSECLKLSRQLVTSYPHGAHARRAAQLAEHASNRTEKKQ